MYCQQASNHVLAAWASQLQHFTRPTFPDVVARAYSKSHIHNNIDVSSWVFYPAAPLHLIDADANCIRMI